MTVGLLIITHQNIGRTLVDAAYSMLSARPLEAHTLEVGLDCNTDTVTDKALSLVRQIDQGDGVLILSDVYGSTPSNIAMTLLEQPNVAAVSGLNLPMLIRVFNYPGLPLPQLADKAKTGGRDGIILRSSTHHG